MARPSLVKGSVGGTRGVRGVGAVAEVVAVSTVELEVSIVLGEGWLPVVLAAAAVRIAPAVIIVAPTLVVHGVFSAAC